MNDDNKRSQAQTKSPRIVVIGSGAAGIAAATSLVSAGLTNVIVLEAENRIGGRIHTVPFADNAVDLGAQWCHGEVNNVVYETVKDKNLLDSDGTIYDDFKLIRSNGQVVDDEIAELLKMIAFQSIDQRQKDLIGCEDSLGTYLTEKYWLAVEKHASNIDRTVASEFLEVFKAFESSIEASDNLYEVSGKGHLEYWICDGDLLLNWRGKGFVTFLRQLMKVKDTDKTDDYGLLNGRILLNKRVERIQWQANDSILLTCFDGQQIQADHVICTVSLGVLKEMHKKLFNPSLPPAKVRAIESLKLGTVGKLFLEFESAFEPADWSGFTFCWLQDDLQQLRQSEYFWLEGLFGFYRVGHQPRLLEGWIIGHYARYMETLPEEEVLKAVLWLIKKFMKTNSIPKVIDFKRTQWYTNPNFRGTYTFRSIYTERLKTGAWDLAAPVLDEESGKPLLQFAGEATHLHYYSTVHGAVESGWREAKRLTDYYSAGNAHL